MKIRTAFVSNSSSSSFILGVKLEVETEDIASVVADNIGITEGCLFFDQKDEIVRALTSRLEPVDIDREIKENEADDWESGIELWKDIKEKSEGLKIFRGWVYTDDAEAAEQMICSTIFHIEKDGFFAHKDERR